ncbi:MAG: VanZ family protein [Proteobacteria bacterium]|nr:VanZ family protein [Pseudomonadota bacterium]
MSNTRPLVLALWAASLVAVAWLSLTPGAETPPLFPHQDKLLHFLAYAWLALLPLRGFATRNAAFTGAGAMIFFGAALEVAQAFVPLRQPSLADLLANSAGVGFGMWLGVRLKMRDFLKRIKMERHYGLDGSPKRRPTDPQG